MVTQKLWEGFGLVEGIVVDQKFGVSTCMIMKAYRTTYLCKYELWNALEFLEKIKSQVTVRF